MLWDRAGAFSKIQLIEGDITQDNLGIHKDDLQDVLRSTNIVIHSAAAVALDDPIKKTLHNNYISTMRVLELCKKMINLHAYAHVSTAYANINFERGSVVKEKIFPLFLGDNVSPLLLVAKSKNLLSHKLIEKRLQSLSYFLRLTK